MIRPNPEILKVTTMYITQCTSPTSERENLTGALADTHITWESMIMTYTPTTHRWIVPLKVCLQSRQQPKCFWRIRHPTLLHMLPLLCPPSSSRAIVKVSRGEPNLGTLIRNHTCAVQPEEDVLAKCNLSRMST